MILKNVCEAVTARRECAPSIPSRVVIPFPTCAACGGALGPRPWTFYATDSQGRDARPLVDVRVCRDCAQGARDNHEHGVAITRALLVAFDAATGEGAGRV